jgi:hypothetical protein
VGNPLVYENQLGFKLGFKSKKNKYNNKENPPHFAMKLFGGGKNCFCPLKPISIKM